MAAGIVMAVNYARVGKKSASRIAAAIGVLATVALIAVMFVIPEDVIDRIPNLAIPAL